ncbi:MAG: DinB family protein [Tepidisphaerales bacterium]
MDRNTLLATLEFTRNRLLNSLDVIEKSGADVAKVLAWRPGPGRAHIAWQAMHCAATHDKYVNGRLKGLAPTDPALCEAYGGGSTPSDQNIPTLAHIRATLDKHYQAFKAFVAEADLHRMVEFPGGGQRSVGESIILLAWHEAHHQGQIHLTWNLYKAHHGMT